MRIRVLLPVALLLAATPLLVAHDLYIKLGNYFVDPNSSVRIPILNGVFDLSENSITRDRVLDISLVTPRDFALVSVAAAMTVTGNVIDDIRIAAGAVQCVPRRLEAVEDLVKGSPQNEATAERAGALAVRGATPLNYNHFKIPLLENLVKRAVRDA